MKLSKYIRRMGLLCLFLINISFSFQNNSLNINCGTKAFAQFEDDNWSSWEGADGYTNSEWMAATSPSQYAIQNYNNSLGPGDYVSERYYSNYVHSNSGNSTNYVKYDYYWNQDLYANGEYIGTETNYEFSFYVVDGVIHPPTIDFIVREGFLISYNEFWAIDMSSSTVRWIHEVEYEEQVIKAQLEYLRTHGESDFVELIEEFLQTPGLTVGDKVELYSLIKKLYSKLKANYIMAIFSPENVGMIFSFCISPNLSTPARNSFFRLYGQFATRGQNITYRAFTANNLRHNLALRTGMNPTSVQAHHVFPQQFRAQFSAYGINIDNPLYGAWWPSATHQAQAWAYNQAWARFLATNPSRNAIFGFARSIMSGHGIPIGF